jgi:hypothetical protein
MDIRELPSREWEKNKNVNVRTGHLLKIRVKQWGFT